MVPEATRRSTTYHASVTTSFKGCCSERAQSSAKAKKTRRFMRMVHRATSASTVLVNLSGAEERKYCTAHCASIVPLSRDATAGEIISRRSWRRHIASCGGFRYRCARPCSRLPFTRASAQNGGDEEVLDFGGPGGAAGLSGATGGVGMRSWGALDGMRSMECARWGVLVGLRDPSCGNRSALLSAHELRECVYYLWWP